MLLVTGGVVLGALLLAIGARRIFAAVLLVALAATGGPFNPLSRGFARMESSEVYQALHQVDDPDRAKGRRGVWLGTGGPSLPIITTIMSAMGVRALTGVFLHPQLGLYHALDPDRGSGIIYNRYGETHYFPCRWATRASCSPIPVWPTSTCASRR